MATLPQVDWNTQIKNRPVAAIDASRFAWSRTPSGSLTAGSPATVTLTPVPPGVNGTDTNHWLYITDLASPTTLAVASGTTTVSSAPITITTSANHGLATGNFVTIASMTCPLANGPWLVTVTGAKTFTLQNSNGGILIVGASNATPIVITTNGDSSPDHGFQTGDTAVIASVTGNTAANGTWTVTRIDATHFSLQTSIGNGDWAGGGTVAGTYTSTSGVVTFGPEAVLITGGTAVSNGTTGTVTFTPKNSHLAGYTIASATAGACEAINYAVSASMGAVAIPAGTSTWHAGLTVPSNFAVIGVPGQSIIKLASGSPSILLFEATGTASTTTTSTTSLTVANRSLVATETIGFASVSGMAAGDYVAMTCSEATYGNVFAQVDVIDSISGSNVTMRDPVLIPLNTAQTGNIIRIVPTHDVVIQDLILDGDVNLGYAQYDASNDIFAISLQMVANSRLENVYFKNWTRSGGLFTTRGHNNKFFNLSALNSGTGGYHDIGFSGQTNAQIDNIDSNRSSGFALGFVECIACQASNLRVSRAIARAMKLNTTGWSSFINVTMQRSMGGNGMAVTQGSYRNQFKNVIANYSGATEGIWFSSQDNQYNIMDGVFAVSNAGQGLIFYDNDHHNVARNVHTAQDVIDLGTNNTLGMAVAFRSAAHNSGNQSCTNGALTTLTWDTNDLDVGGVHSTSSNPTRFTMPAGSGGSTSATQGGMWMLVAQVDFAFNNTGQRAVRWLKNGTTVVGQTVVQAVTNAATPAFVQCVCTPNLAAGEYVEVQVFQDSGGALNALAGANNTFASVVRMY